VIDDSFLKMRYGQKFHQKSFTQETSMTSVIVNVPDSVFSALRKTPDEFGQEM
jgi:hypothetical protein